MMISNLIQKRQEVNFDLRKCLETEFSNIKVSADNMVECATNIRGQGYQQFISAREELFSKVDALRESLLAITDINTNTHR